MGRAPGGGEIVEEHFDANDDPLDGPGGAAHVSWRCAVSGA